MTAITWSQYGSIEPYCTYFSDPRGHMVRRAGEAWECLSGENYDRLAVAETAQEAMALCERHIASQRWIAQLLGATALSTSLYGRAR